jgi:hypothetical protein
VSILVPLSHAQPGFFRRCNPYIGRSNEWQERRDRAEFTHGYVLILVIATTEEGDAEDIDEMENFDDAEDAVDAMDAEDAVDAENGGDDPVTHNLYGRRL